MNRMDRDWWLGEKKIEIDFIETHWTRDQIKEAMIKRVGVVRQLEQINEFGVYWMMLYLLKNYPVFKDVSEEKLSA